MIRCRRSSTLFPYTTLFRSQLKGEDEAGGRVMARSAMVVLHEIAERLLDDRSEEHTSELQSRGHLVCRLLLEKKKIDIGTATGNARQHASTARDVADVYAMK